MESQVARTVRVVSTEHYLLKDWPARLRDKLVVCRSSTDLARALQFQIDPKGKAGLAVSRAFVNEDAGSVTPRRDYALPGRDDPGFDAAAAEALLEAARAGETASAEVATGYYWGEKRLREQVRRIRDRAAASGDERLAQLGDRFLG